MPSFESKLFGYKTPEAQAEAEISFFEKPAQKILELLREKIDHKEYDAVLGDDADARVHALVIGGALKEIYSEEKKIEIAFVQGGALLSNPKLEPEHAHEVKEYLERIKSRLGHKVLIVTEEVFSGVSVEKIALMLRELGIEADVAAFGVADSEPFQGANPYITAAGIKIYFGRGGMGPTMLKEHLGVFNRTRSGSGHAEAKYPYDPLERQQIRAAREAVRPLAHKLAQEYLTKS